MESDALALTNEEMADLRVRASDTERLRSAAFEAQRVALYAEESWRTAVRTAINVRGLPGDRLYRVDYEQGRLVDAGPVEPEPAPIEAAAI